MPMLKQVVDVLETLYPLRYAESWDHPGLIVGDLSAPVRRIEFAADPTMEVVRQAIERGTDLLICHHPLLFRSVHEVSGLGVHGDIVRRLSQAGCALWVGHTNADAAYRGTGMAAADLFGLVDQRPLVPIDDPTGRASGGIGTRRFAAGADDAGGVRPTRGGCAAAHRTGRAGVRAAGCDGAHRRGAAGGRGTRCSTRCAPPASTCT